MNCPRCNRTANLMATEPGQFGTERRRYLCASDHHFTTVEVYEPQNSASFERNLLVKALRAIQEKFFPARRTA